MKVESLVAQPGPALGLGDARRAGDLEKQARAIDDSSFIIYHLLFTIYCPNGAAN
jgi:hypothetical protein